MFAKIIVIFMTSHMIVDTSLDFLHGSGAQFGEIAGPSRPQIHKGLKAMESVYVRDCVDRCSQEHSEYEYGVCFVGMHVLPIKDTEQVKFKVLDGTESTLSMPMLRANRNGVILSGEVATLITAKGETAPLMNAGNDWYLKVLINNTAEFIRIDVWTLCHTCPPSWVWNLSPEMKQRERCIVREQTGRKDYENSRKSMHLYLKSFMDTTEMEILRSLSNPEEMDDAELLKDLKGWASRRRSMGKIRCLSIQKWIREKRLLTYELPEGTHE